MGLGIHIGVDTHTDPRRPVHLCGDAPDVFELLGGLYVEHENVGIQGFPDFVLLLAHAGEDDFAWIDAGRQGPVQFSPGDDIHTGTKAAQQAKEIDIAVGLDRKTGQVVKPTQGRVESVVMPPQGFGGIDIQGRTELFCQVADAKFFRPEFSVAVLKIIHGWDPFLGEWLTMAHINT